MPSGQLWSRTGRCSRVCGGRDRAAICPFTVACLCVNVLVAMRPKSPLRDSRHAAYSLARRGCGTSGVKMRSGVRSSGNQPLAPKWDSTKYRIRSHLFRAWTACAILAAYVYGWLYVPEMLTWWKRTTTTIIEGACDHLPYPWGDRIEATIGNFGLWVLRRLRHGHLPLRRERSWCWSGRRPRTFG